MYMLSRTFLNHLRQYYHEELNYSLSFFLFFSLLSLFSLFYFCVISFLFLIVFCYLSLFTFTFVLFSFTFVFPSLFCFLSTYFSPYFLYFLYSLFSPILFQLLLCYIQYLYNNIHPTFVYYILLLCTTPYFTTYTYISNTIIITTLSRSSYILSYIQGTYDTTSSPYHTDAGCDGDTTSTQYEFAAAFTYI